MLLALAGSRAFDKGLFDKSRQDETVLQASKNDLKDMIVSLGFDLPKFVQDSPDSSKWRLLEVYTCEMRTHFHVGHVVAKSRNN